MKKVITYGTYDCLHFGHVNLLRRAKALGDYLIVGVTSDDYDKSRGKINVRQSLADRIEAVRATGYADEIIIEEYEGQKIDDIRKYGIDIFTVGSDWTGKFDYLKTYCEVVYLERTEGVSSSEIRAEKRALKLGLVGDSNNINKVEAEAAFVNGLEIHGKVPAGGEAYDALLKGVDAVYVYAHPTTQYALILQALNAGKHVLAEAPMALSKSQLETLEKTARENGVVLMEALKTAFSTAYRRLILLLKTGKIGDIVSVQAACTSMAEPVSEDTDLGTRWSSITDWGPTALLPVFQILGTDFISKQIITKQIDEEKKFDVFSKVDFVFKNAAASVMAGTGVKTEGELVISGTRGYIYVSAPWWKTDSFEVRFEDQRMNERFFYKLEGEGIRYELAEFLKAASGEQNVIKIETNVTDAITGIMEDYFSDTDVIKLGL